LLDHHVCRCRDLRGADRVRHAEAGADQQAGADRRGRGARGDHGRARALPRLHQPLPLPAADLRAEPLARLPLREYAPMISGIRHKLGGALLVTLVVVSATCAVAPGAALAGTLDQQQTVFDVGTGTIDSGETPAQTFTAGLSGGIDQVDLYLDAHGAPT